MAKRHIPDSHTSHPNVTPLIDIIMCLIIFFMLVAKIGVSSGAVKIEIPVTLQGVQIKDMGNTFTINVPDRLTDTEPQISALVNTVMTNLQLRTASGQNELVNVLNEFKKQNPNYKVIIRAKADLPWLYLEPVLDACNQAGVHNINYNTKEAPH